ncbi:MAG: SCO family protein [Alphaproteobacteria bacterium]|nr:MAG: SCO family protein [Alphaproteobacteria bacterium]
MSLLLAGVVANTFASAGAGPALKAGVFNPPRLAPEFSLRGSDGSEVTLARYRGKVVVMAFGYTSCAAVCPMTLATLTEARSSLGEAADAVQVIYVTVDPERDDADRMKDFLTSFDPSFVGATGAPDVLAAVRQNYFVTAIKHGTGGDYVMDHTSSIYLIDRTGKLRALMPYGHDAADFVHDIKMLLVQ